MQAIEDVSANEGLKGVLPKNCARPTPNQTMLAEHRPLLRDRLTNGGDRARVLLGRAYKYFLSGFASSEGKRGG